MGHQQDVPVGVPALKLRDDRGGPVEHRRHGLDTARRPIARLTSAALAGRLGSAGLVVGPDLRIPLASTDVVYGVPDPDVTVVPSLGVVP